MTHTPGPWFWEMRGSNRARLYTPKNGSCTVMDFVRSGLQGALPRFSNRNGEPLGGIMLDATEEVLQNNPDARLIAAAPELLNELIHALACIRGDEDPRYDEIIAAIAKAQPAGETDQQ